MRIPRAHGLTLEYCRHFGLELRPFVMGNPKGLVHIGGQRMTLEEAQRSPERLPFDLAPHERGKTADQLWMAAIADIKALLDRDGASAWEQIRAECDQFSLYEFLKYRNNGYNIFLDPEGYPAISPPWGTLSAIDLNAGEIRWKVPFGEYPALAGQGLRDTGTDNYGGAVVTANGLLFIGATTYDRKFRVFDKHTGRLLWETELPASGNATPSLYLVNGKQYVAIACGGGKNGAAAGGSYVAFALPEQ